ncbi:dehydration-responsive element-binding protein 3-like [Cynara cardunculus var. scolymus]|nr:dehydration-responsive element-binding protein 3-like [Cynara cardunculus var. scolymus]
MAARAHDVAALSIKGKSAILNFPELSDLLPRPVSCSPCDIQAAATKAASMVHLNHTTTATPRCTPSTSATSTCSATSSMMLEEVSMWKPQSEELSEIVELPSVGEGFDHSVDFVFVDSGWDYYSSPPPWAEDGDGDGDGGYLGGEPSYVTPSFSGSVGSFFFDASSWQY